MSHYRGRLNSLALLVLSAIGSVFDRQAALLRGTEDAAPGPVSRRARYHDQGGTAAAKRAARKRRNVIRNRRAHRN